MQGQIYKEIINNIIYKKHLLENPPKLQVQLLNTYASTLILQKTLSLPEDKIKILNKLCNSRVSCNGVYFIEYEAKLLGSIKAFSVAVQYRHPFSTDTVDREKIIRQCLLYQKKPWKTFTGGKIKPNLIFVKYTYPTQPTLKQ